MRTHRDSTTFLHWLLHWLLVLVVGVATVLAVVAVPRAEAVAPSIELPLPCGDMLRLDVAGVALCTHGPDMVPAAQAGGSGEPVETAPVTCIGDGRSGQRVEVLYVHGSDRGAASSALRGHIRRWVGQVEWTVTESARRHGGDRRVRWRTDDCAVRVASTRVSGAALGDFEEMIDELRERGYSRSDRTYLLFVDANALCGIATAPRDDSASSNRADRTTGYARVDRRCWDAGDEGYHSIAAHELLHTLGAVQESAPHATEGAHCTDEHDLLCYDDGTGGAMRVVCRDSDDSTSGAGDAFDRLLDCRGDDYFNPSPRRGSYLDSHWNTADSARLHDPDAEPEEPGDDPPPPQDDPPSPVDDPVGYAFWLVFG